MKKNSGLALTYLAWVFTKIYPLFYLLNNKCPKSSGIRNLLHYRAILYFEISHNNLEDTSLCILSFQQIVVCLQFLKLRSINNSNFFAFHLKLFSKTIFLIFLVCVVNQKKIDTFFFLKNVNNSNLLWNLADKLLMVKTRFLFIW